MWVPHSVLCDKYYHVFNFKKNFNSTFFCTYITQVMGFLIVILASGLRNANFISNGKRYLTDMLNSNRSNA